MALITFRNSKIVYYGPHSCENCGIEIVKMGHEWGGTAFTNPEGPIYPNTEWHPHVCDPKLVRAKLGSNAMQRVTADFPLANAFKVGELGFVILGEQLRQEVQGGSYLCISPNHSFHDTADSAWTAALERASEGWPSWHIDLSMYGPNSKYGNDLELLPECN